MAADTAHQTKADWSRNPDSGICVRGLVVLLGALVLLPTALKAQVEALPEPQLKALFLYNFAKFVDWPSNAHARADSPLVIGIIGDNPFENYLEQTVDKKKINEHPLVIKSFKSMAETRAAAASRALHMIFISRSSPEKISTVLDGLKEYSVLTVSDTESSFEAGTMINFVRVEDKVGFVINNGAARKVGLGISSKLLSLAKRVKT
jgi:hypothetical protein